MSVEGVRGLLEGEVALVSQVPHLVPLRLAPEVFRAVAAVQGLGAAQTADEETVVLLLGARLAEARRHATSCWEQKRLL